MKTNFNFMSPQFKGKSRSIVKLIDPTKAKYNIDSKVLLALRDCEAKIESLAKQHGVPEVKLAQNGEHILINTGAVTNYLEKSKAYNAETLYDSVEANILENKRPFRFINMENNEPFRTLQLK